MKTEDRLAVELALVVPASCWFTSNRFPTNRGYHARMKDELRLLATHAYREAGRPQLDGPVRVYWWIGYPPRARDVDPANAQPVTKPILDQWVRDGLLPDDNAHVVVAETFLRDPEPAAAGVHTIRMSLQQADTNDMSVIHVRTLDGKRKTAPAANRGLTTTPRLRSL